MRRGLCVNTFALATVSQVLVCMPVTAGRLRQEHRQRHYSTYIAPQTAYRSCSVAFVSLSPTERLSVAQSKPTPTDFELQPNSICSPGLPFDGLHPRKNIITWITTHVPTPEGWKAELAWVAGP